jgi:hypothetical protein
MAWAAGNTFFGGFFVETGGRPRGSATKVDARLVDTR